MPTFIAKVLCLVTRVQALKPPFSETNDTYGASITLLGYFLSRRASLLKPYLLIELFHHIAKLLNIGEAIYGIMRTIMMYSS